jgi:hypothetical protein
MLFAPLISAKDLSASLREIVALWAGPHNDTTTPAESHKSRIRVFITTSLFPAVQLHICQTALLTGPTGIGKLVLSSRRLLLQAST